MTSTLHGKYTLRSAAGRVVAAFVIMLASSMAGQSTSQLFKTNGPYGEAMYADGSISLDLYVYTQTNGNVAVDYYLYYYSSSIFIHGYGEVPAGDLVVRGKTMILETDISRFTDCSGTCGPGTSGKIAAVWEKTDEWFRSTTGTEVYRTSYAKATTRTVGSRECSSAQGTVTIFTETRPSASYALSCMSHNSTVMIQREQ